MKVSTIGFEIQLSKGIDFKLLCDHLVSLSDNEIKIHNRIHVPYIGMSQNYVQGLILSYRSSKKSLITERDTSGDLVVKKTELGAGQNGTEVSIFTINPITGRGVMYSYFGSLSESGYKVLFGRAHNVVRKNLIRQLKDNSGAKGKKAADEVKNVMGEKNTYDFKILKTPADLDKLLELFQDIGSVSLTAEDALASAGLFQPLELYAKNASISVKLDTQNHTSQKIKQVIKQVFSHWDRSKPKSFTLVGLAHGGQELTRKLGENSDDFGKIQFDDYVEILPVVKWKDFYTCKAATDMIELIRKNTVVFGPIP